MPLSLRVASLPRLVTILGLSRAQIKGAFEEAGLDAKAAKLRSKQIFHWLYHRGETEFDAMTDLAKPMRGWMAERFIVGRPQVVEAQVSSDGTRKWLLKTDDGHEFEMVFIPMRIAERCAFPAKSAARSIAASVIRARCAWSAI